MHAQRPNTLRVLILYTELAPYFLACLRALMTRDKVEVWLVRWPVNKEAPFDLVFGGRVHVIERHAHNDHELQRICVATRPHIALASGWVDKTYLRICKELHRLRVPTVMCSDTAWKGTFRQWAAVVKAQFWIRNTFSHAWVTGAHQARYAHILGFEKRHIRQGFYSADVKHFAAVGTRTMPAKQQAFPHRFLCVARYIPTKGHQLLCDVFAELCDEDRSGDWELWIAGTGELHEAVAASPSGQHPRIRHLGFVQPDDMEQVQAQCGVFILPSTFEPWGVVVHEHAVAGFPLLLSDAVGAGKRFLIQRLNGLQFRAGSAISLQRAMRTFIEMKDKDLLSMAEESRKLGHTWDPDQWADVITELTDASHG